jgi:hypothetical protein
MSLTLKDLKSLITYDPDTGLFYKTDKISADNPEGLITHNPRNRVKMISIYGMSYTASRIAWFYMTGAFPREGMVVSFKNKNTTDFKWDNLIEVNRSILKINSKPPKAYPRKKKAA